MRVPPCGLGDHTACLYLLSSLTSPDILLHLFFVWCVCMHLCLPMWVGTCTMAHVWRVFCPPTWESLGLFTGHHMWRQQPLLTDHRSSSSSCPEQYLTLWMHCEDSLPWPFPVSACYEHRCCEHLFEAKRFRFSSIKTQKWNNWVIISRDCLSLWGNGLSDFQIYLNSPAFFKIFLYFGALGLHPRFTLSRLLYMEYCSVWLWMTHC